MAKKLLDFNASISEVKQVNPLFSTCKVRVLYTGKNRNMSTITKDAVEKALPTLKNIPIVGEFSEENKDFKGHGGAVDLDSYKYIHTTKPYGVVPESATYEWEEINGKEYLTIDGCYLWTGRYEEAFEVINSGSKNQSMEIEVTSGQWLEEEESYRIDNFIFSALCILGDDVEPAFEDASVMAYSLDKNQFKEEFTQMLQELKFSLSEKNDFPKEVNEVLKELLKKYSTTVETLTEKGLDFSQIAEDELEAKIAETLGVDVFAEEVEDVKEDAEDVKEDDAEDVKEDAKEDIEDVKEDEVEEVEEKEESVDVEAYELKIADLEKQLETANQEIATLKDFKLNAEKEKHEVEVKKIFANFQLNDKDIENIDIHNYSLEEIEDKCYSILGRKLAKKKYSNGDGIHLPINTGSAGSQTNSKYGDLLD